LRYFNKLIIYSLHLDYDFKVNGSLVDTLDYFITIYEHNPDIKLVLLESSESHKNKLRNFVLNRYNLDAGFIHLMFDNIIVCSRLDLRMAKINKLLLMDLGTIRDIYNYCPIVCEDIHIIVEDGSEGIFKKAKYYSEIPEIFDVYGSTRYIIKMRLDLIKKPTIIKSGTYVNHRNNPLYIDFNPNYVREHMIVKAEMDMVYDNWFFKKDTPVDNLFEEFDTFVYYKSCDWFDTHPRLFTECFYFNKKIIYINKGNVKDGSWYRYYDLINNGINHRFLTKDDEIVKEFI